MKEFPLVSIAAICYNHSPFILEALESIKNQTYPNIELIIVDDCSTDNSVDLIKEWLTDYKKSYKLIIHQKNVGIIATNNEGLNNASGKYFSFLATDDAIMPDKITDQVNLMESSNHALAMVYGDCMMIDEKGEILHKSLFELYRGDNFNPPSGEIFKDVLEGFYFYSHASLIHLGSIKKLNYNFKEGVISEDWDLELVLARNYKIASNNKVYAKYRRSNTSITSLNWSADKYHKIHMSHFKMIAKYYKHPLNTEHENKLVLHKLREINQRLFQSKNCSFNHKIFYPFKIFKFSKSFRDIMVIKNNFWLHR